MFLKDFLRKYSNQFVEELKESLKKFQEVIVKNALVLVVLNLLKNFFNEMTENMLEILKKAEEFPRK